LERRTRVTTLRVEELQVEEHLARDRAGISKDAYNKTGVQSLPSYAVVLESYVEPRRLSLASHEQFAEQEQVEPLRAQTESRDFP
jgi:hypothetical protein